MKVLNRTVSLRQLVLVAVVALTVGIGGSAVASNSKEAAPAPRDQLGSEGGFTYKSNTESVTSGTQEYLQVACPNRKSVTGGGVYSSNGYGGSAVNSTFPIDRGDSGSTPDDGWAAYVDGYSGGSATVYAICG